MSNPFRIIIVVLSLAIALAGCGRMTAKTEGYQAVFLDSGAVFFGQMQGLGTAIA